jgi:hypothetical protein
MAKMTVEDAAEEMFKIFDTHENGGEDADVALAALSERIGDLEVMAAAFMVVIKRLGNKGMRDLAIMKASEAFDFDPSKLN